MEMLERLGVECKGETILFVDDEVRQLRLMQQFLEECGYRVLTAKDGVEAVELYSRYKHEIALVVLDLRLPHLNGAEALHAIKKTTPEIKAIAATAYLPLRTDMSDWRAVIMKPYRLDDIVAQISRVLREP